MKLVGANPQAPVAGLDELSGKTNYFIGNEPAKWRTNIATYGKVKYRQVYRGVDVVYYGNQQQLEYDFVISSGADPRVIKLQFAGADHLRIDAAGNLVLDVVGSRVVQQAPVIYQESDGVRQAVSGRYVLLGRRQVGFRVGAYDRSRPLVIDPSLVYSTYLGGLGADAGFAIAVDTAGNAYVTGTAGHPPTFPTTPGAFGVAGTFVFLTKLNATGTALVYSTLFGGTQHMFNNDHSRGIAVDSSGNAIVGGDTDTKDFPTVNALQTYPHAPMNPNGSAFNGFLIKFNATGSGLIFSAYFGGYGGVGSGIRGVALDPAGNIYVTGGTDTRDTPATPDNEGIPVLNAAQPNNAGGTDAFVAKFTPSGGLSYSTYLGGGDNDSGLAIAVDASQNAYVTGLTTSIDNPATPENEAFPTVNAFQPTCADCAPGTARRDAFVTKVIKTF